ncbi:MAG: hypothetical protein ABIP97_03240, partial [Chthoniobacterales bacterium]
MIHKGILTLVCLLASYAALFAQTLTFQIADKPVDISASGQIKLISQIQRIVLSTNYNSRDNPKAWFPETRWTELKDLHSYIHVSYPKEKMFETAGGDINATDVWIEIKDKKQKGALLYPGPITLVNAGASVVK